jgi:hypothetical protein
MAELPEKLLVGSERSGTFELRAGLRAVRRPAGSEGPDALAVIPDDAATCYAIVDGEAGRRGAGREEGPVYSAGSGGPLAVPTGRVFVRLAAPLRPGQRRAELAAAGFEIERELAYAPQAAWLRPAAGGVEAALRGLDALARIPGIEHVEPQMLLERALKR